MRPPPHSAIFLFPWERVFGKEEFLVSRLCSEVGLCLGGEGGGFLFSFHCVHLKFKQ